MHQEFLGYDIIGDVHGCHDELVQLLELLGYKKNSGVYSHTNRQAVFLGDLVDRGPKIRETLHLVHEMVERGSAQIVLGNHEISVIAYHTPTRATNEQSYIRERTEGHRLQLQQTLEQFENHPHELGKFVEWFYSIPLFLEFEHFRVAHACWDQMLIDAYLRRYQSNLINEDILHLTLDYQSLEFKLINRLTRGTSLRLPEGKAIISKDGVRRRFFRTKFWLPEPQTYGDVVFQPDALPGDVQNTMLNEADRAQLLSYNEEEKPLFVGHYWRSGTPALLQRNIVCLDYSAVYGGRLVAYRIDQPGQLDAKNLVWVEVSNN